MPVRRWETMGLLFLFLSRSRRTTSGRTLWVGIGLTPQGVVLSVCNPVATQQNGGRSKFLRLRKRE